MGAPARCRKAVKAQQRIRGHAAEWQWPLRSLHRANGEISCSGSNTEAAAACTIAVPDLSTDSHRGADSQRRVCWRRCAGQCCSAGYSTCTLQIDSERCCQSRLAAARFCSACLHQRGRHLLCGSSILRCGQLYCGREAQPTGAALDAYIIPGGILQAQPWERSSVPPSNMVLGASCLLQA